MSPSFGKVLMGRNQKEKVRFLTAAQKCSVRPIGLGIFQYLDYLRLGARISLKLEVAQVGSNPAHYTSDGERTA